MTKNIRFYSRGWVVALAMVLGVVVAAALRFGFLEDEAQAALCRAGSGETICSLRTAVGWSIHYQLFGLGGVLIGMLAWLPRLQRMALPGLVLSTVAMALYNTTFGAVGLIVALLAALR